MRSLALIGLLLSALAPVSGRAEQADALVLLAGPKAPYETARRSLLEGLGDDVQVATLELDELEVEEAARRVRRTRPAVLVTLGSQATRWALSHTEEIPIVFAMVLQPVRSGFVRSFERPGGRVTGAALDVLPAVHFRTLRDVLEARRVGVLFNPDETGSLVESARKAARDEGIELVSFEVRDPSALDHTLGQITGQVDALWSVPDRTVFGRGAVQRVLLHTLEHDIPFVGLSEQYVRAGALMALATSLGENGRQAAERVRRVLAREPPRRIPVARPDSVEVVYNAHVARRLGLRIPAPARSVPP